jgi:hypothetical protein
MFDRRSLPDDVAAVRKRHAPDALVLDADGEFETLPPTVAEELGLLVDALDPASHPDEWLPDDAPATLRRYAGDTLTVGMAGDGTVTWTRQTDPPVVVTKARAEGTPTAFLDFLLAEALVQVGLSAPLDGAPRPVPEHALPFFGPRYRDLDDAVALGPADTYQVAVALYEAWLGLFTRETFADWEDARPRLFAAWDDAGERLTDRLDGLPRAVARGDTSFADATEFACAAVKHGRDLPAPFSALETAAYRERGPDYAVRWAEKTFERLD